MKKHTNGFIPAITWIAFLLIAAFFCIIIFIGTFTGQNENAWYLIPAGLVVICFILLFFVSSYFTGDPVLLEGIREETLFYLTPLGSGSNWKDDLQIYKAKVAEEFVIVALEKGLSEGTYFKKDGKLYTAKQLPTEDKK